MYEVIYIFCPPLRELFPRFLIPYVGWLVFHMIFTLIAEFLEMGLLLYLSRKVPKIFFYIASGMILQIPLRFGRLWGVISFHWRKYNW